MKLVHMATDSLITVWVPVIDIFLDLELFGFNKLFIRDFYVLVICVPICRLHYIGIFFWSEIITFWTLEYASLLVKQRRCDFCVFCCWKHVFSMYLRWKLLITCFHSVSHRNQSVEPKKTVVLLFCEQLKLKQKQVHAGFLVNQL